MNFERRRDELDKVLFSGENLELMPGREQAQLTEKHDKMKFAIGLYVSLYGGELIAYKGKYDLDSGSLPTVDYEFVVRCKTNDNEAIAALAGAFGTLAQRSTTTVSGEEYTYFNCRLRFAAERPRK